MGSESFNQRQWERAYLEGERSFLEHRFSDAAKAYNAAYDYVRHGDSDKQFAALLGLGNALAMEGNYDRALQCYKNAVALVNDSNNVGDKALCLFYLGKLYFDNHKLTDAEDALRQSVSMFEIAGARTSALSSRDYACALAMLARALIADGKLADAESAFNTLSQAQLIAACPARIVEKVKSELASALAAHGQAKKASALLLVDQWRSQCAAAILAKKQGADEEAKKHYLNALAFAQGAPNNSLLLSTTYASLGAILFGQRAFEQAADCYRKALAEREQLYVHPDATKDELYRYLVRIEMFGPLPLVEPDMKHWRALRAGWFGPDDASTAEVDVTMACIYDRHHRDADCIACASRAAQILEGTTSPNRTVPVHCEYLGDLLLCRAQYNEAIQLYEHAIALLHKSKRKSDAREFLLRLKMGMGKQGPAAAHPGRSAIGPDAIEHQMQWLERNPGGANYVGSGLAYLMRDLQENQMKAQSDVAAQYLQRILGMQPTGINQTTERIIKASLAACAANKLPPIKKLVGRIQPGTLEDQLKAD